MQTEYHKLVVDRYTTKCNRAYACLENDSYVYQKLPYHMAASGMYMYIYTWIIKACMPTYMYLQCIHVHTMYIGFQLRI